MSGGRPPKGGPVPCKRCGELFQRKVGRNHYCDTCRRPARLEYSRRYNGVYYVKNVERIKERTARYQKENVERKRRWGREHMARRARLITTQVFGHYSTGTFQCACCGQFEREFLTVDHVGGNGNKMSRESGIPRGGFPLYFWLFKNRYPPGFEIVCMNCNLSRAKHGGLCRHRMVKQS